eukprot:TRINITY_DN48926_c0_g1_i1.p1 TRINITY_DN48926_c0_g1~~TRINITY_DN48926_c0_g1_i1.p1  ORF type:complete len:201 (+),score=38.47 TRINITY_DN48926_c0_g1_i1:68-604(+)
MSVPPWVLNFMQMLPGPLQMKVQEVLMQVMQDMYLPALATLPTAWALIYIPHFVKVHFVVKHTSLTGYDNCNPRSFNPEESPDAGVIKRAKACHENALEGFPAFAAAVLLCKVQKVPAMQTSKLALRYILCRIIFTLCYLLGGNQVVAAGRSAAWIGGMGSVAQLFKAALTAKKALKA